MYLSLLYLSKDGVNVHVPDQRHVQHVNAHRMIYAFAMWSELKKNTHNLSTLKARDDLTRAALDGGGVNITPSRFLLITQNGLRYGCETCYTLFYINLT